MSSLKNINKKFQRVHRERRQPAERRKLGYLEKKKDYKKRANDYQAKESRLKDLRKQVLDKNPDEFHFHMINSEVKDGRHFEKKNPHDEHSEEQIKLIQSQDYQYISYKRTMELAKIEKLKSTLHLIDYPEKPKNKHIIFVDSNEEVDNFDWKSHAGGPFQLVDGGDVKGRQKAYRELKRREERARQLDIILEKMRLKIQMNKTKGGKPQKVKDGNPDSAPLYVWPKERQR